jgi:anti-sigma factor RsiW
MNCDEVKLLVGRYADGELDDLQARAIEQHLRGCTDCTAKHQGVLTLRAQVRSELPYFTAPPALRERMRALLAPAQPPERARALGERWRWLIGGALGGCAATVLAWVVGTAVIDYQANQDLAGEAVAMHTRATLDNHLVDVASSDQHTVKPWLSARLDYSPPVRDFAAEGFPLLGGRLDLLDRRRVATLVYRYRLHTIDVFVTPEAPRAPQPLRTLRGFNVAQATGSGMHWLAVSDVSADVLAAFVERLARESGSPGNP